MSASPIGDVLNSVADAMATDPRDWSLAKRDAWLYGIFLGWGTAMREVAALHQWSPEAVDRLKSYRRIVSVEQRKERAAKAAKSVAESRKRGVGVAWYPERG